MNNKQYPTRMHEILTKPGEPPLRTGEVFTVAWTDTTVDYALNCHGEPELVAERDCDGYCPPAPSYDVVYMINHPERITRRPQPTQEQVAQLKVAHQAFEFNWLARHKNGVVAVFKRKPVKGNNGYWFIDELVLGYNFGLAVREGSLICSLVSWSDPEPLDIVATLKTAGVEVEE